MIISIGNRKGGTGKTTTVVNIGRAMALAGKQVLLIDMDPQANLSYSFGISTEGCLLGEVLLEGEVDYGSVFYKNGIDLIPSNNQLQDYENEFIRRDYALDHLKKALETVKEQYDYILIDCPPAASFLTRSALNASDLVLIPMQLDFLSFEGTKQMIALIKEINDNHNPDLKILGAVAVLVDERRQLTKHIWINAEETLNIYMFKSFIRQNVKAAEAPHHSLSVLDYAPNCNSALDYLNLTEEILKITENIEVC